MADIAAVGHVTHDLYHDGLVAGGCAFYAAQVYAALAAHVRLVGVVGDDFQLDDALLGIDTALDRMGETTTFYNHYEPDAPRLQLLEGHAPKVPPQLVEASLVHLAPVLLECDLTAWLRANPDALFAMNVQGWIKEPGERVGELDPSWPRGLTGDARIVRPVRWTPGDEDLAAVDVACMSEEDLFDQPGLGARLVRNVRWGCFTVGAKGSWVWDGDETFRVGALEVDVVDTTGAGDTFAATFSHGIWSGRTVQEAASRATAAASLVIEEVGASALGRLADELEPRAAKVVVERRSRSELLANFA